MAPKANSLKKMYGSEFLQSSFIFVIYLLKEVYRKIMRKSILWAKLDMRILQRLALNRIIILLALVGYEMIIANSVLRASLAKPSHI